MKLHARILLAVVLAAVAGSASCREALAQTSSLLSSNVSPANEMAQGPPATGTAPTLPPADSGASLTEINKQLVNPVSTLWSLTFQQNNYGITLPAGQVGHQDNLLFQPVLPVALTNDWNLITRPVIPLFNSVPTIDPLGNLGRTTGFGDTDLVEILSPSTNLVGPNWLLGLGPTFIFLPPATPISARGSGRWVLPGCLVTSAINLPLGCSPSNGGRLAVMDRKI